MRHETPTVLPGLVTGSRGPWQYWEIQAAGSWQEGRVSSDMCSLKLAAGTAWPRAQVSLSQPLTAHQPAPHWAGALEVEGAPRYLRSQREATCVTHRGSGSHWRGPKRKASLTKPQSASTDCSSQSPAGAGTGQGMRATWWTQQAKLER